VERVIAYVDGFNLYFGLREKGWKRYYWLNLELLSENLLKPDQVLDTVYYFTSRTTDDPGKMKRQNTFLEALETLPKVRIKYGKYHSNPHECKKCGYIYRRYKEKMSDVNLAVQLLVDAFQDRFDTAMIVSGDGDLSGLIGSVRQLFPGKRIVMAFPPGRCSGNLSRVASAHFMIGQGILKRSLFPDRVQKKDGFALVRPVEWR
jgi:uncharacterized LabA/DUF88 family protein